MKCSHTHSYGRFVGQKKGREPDSLKRALRQVAGVTDDELFHLMYEVAANPSAAICLLPLFMISPSGRPFVPVWLLDIPVESFDAIQARQQDISCTWEDIETQVQTRN